MSMVRCCACNKSMDTDEPGSIYAIVEDLYCLGCFEKQESEVKRKLPTRTYDLEHSLGRGLPWGLVARYENSTRREMEAEVENFTGCNPGSRFRIKVVKAAIAS